MAGIAIIEPVVPARDLRQKRRRSQQRTIGLAGRDVDTGRRAGELLEVEDVGGEGAAGVGRGYGRELVRVEGGGEVDVCFEEFGAAAVVEVEGGEYYVDALGFPVTIGLQWMVLLVGKGETTYINKPGGGVSTGGLGRVERQAVFGAAVG